MQATWYRIVSASYDATANTTNLYVAGVDWLGGSANVNALIIPTVTGVYTTTVQLDNSEIWTR